MGELKQSQEKEMVHLEYDAWRQLAYERYVDDWKPNMGKLKDLDEWLGI